MANIRLEHVYKKYPNGKVALKDFSFSIKSGEFIVVLGDKNSSKSTLLRCISGLEKVDSGEIYCDNILINDVECQDRNFSMVIDENSLFPSMTVYENLTFSMRIKKYDEKVIKERLLYVCDFLSLIEYLDKKPSQLSPLICQKVALARAIIKEQKLVMLDEPLLNLDNKGRNELKNDLLRIHQKTKMTFIYATQDKKEALNLADRIILIKDGEIIQIANSKELYDYPKNQYVASCIASDISYFNVSLFKEKDETRIYIKDNKKSFRIDNSLLLKMDPRYRDGNKNIILGVRSEDIYLCDEKEALFDVVVSYVEEQGSNTVVYANLKLDETDVDAFNGNITFSVRSEKEIKTGDILHVSFIKEKLFFFDAENEESILSKFPTCNYIPALIDNEKLNVLGKSLSLPSLLKTPDLQDGTLQVPLNGIYLNDEEGFDAKVISIEDFNNEKFITFSCHDFILFSTFGQGFNLKADDKVKIGLDLTKATLINNDAKCVMFKPIEEFDEFNANFFDYKTAFLKTNNEEFKNYRDNKINAALEYFNAKIKIENNSYKNKKTELDVNDLELEKNEALSEYKAILKANEKKKKEINSTYKEKKVELKNKYIEDKKKVKNDNYLLFLDQKENENSEYKNFKINFKDKETLHRRSDEHHLFNEEFMNNKNADLLYHLDLLNSEYDENLISLKANKKRKLISIHKENSDAKHKFNLIASPYKSLDKEHKTTLKQLDKKKEQSVKRASYVFFLCFADKYFEILNDRISNKIITALKSKVFSKTFKVLLSHDSYSIVEEGGLELFIDNNLNYGDVIYVRCSYIDNDGIRKFLYLKSDKEYIKGDRIRVKFDLEKCQIKLTDENLRLY